jgi:hypothetical protein
VSLPWTTAAVTRVASSVRSDRRRRADPALLPVAAAAASNNLGAIGFGTVVDDARSQVLVERGVQHEHGLQHVRAAVGQSGATTE